MRSRFVFRAGIGFALGTMMMMMGMQFADARAKPVVDLHVRFAVINSNNSSALPE